MPTIAIIGAGTMGREHARAWAALGHGGDIRFVCSPSGASLADAPLARPLTDPRQLLLDPEVDVVSVCTPTDTHRDLASRALAAGKHVLLEKPIALTLGDAEALRDSAAASGTVLMVAHVVRFFPGYRDLLALARSGTLGSPRTVRARRLAAAGRPRWLSDDERSGGMVVDFAIHDFDQLDLLLGSPHAVRAVLLPGGAVETTVEYRDGAIGQVLTDWSMPAGFPFTSSLEVNGDRGLATYTLVAPAREGSGRSAIEVVGPDGTDSTVVPQGDPFVAQARCFLDCIAAGVAPPDCSVDSAVTALTVALAARESLDSGRAVVLEPRPA